MGPGVQKELSRGTLADPIQRDIHVGGLAIGVYDRQVWAEADTCDRRTPIGHPGLRHGIRPWDAAFYDTQKLTGSSRQGGLFNTWTAKLNNLNFHPLEVLSRCRDPQLQVR